MDPELWRCVIFLAQNSPFAQMRIFSENLLISLVPFIQAYLHAKNQSQIQIKIKSINEILMIKEYWNLIGWEPFLAITWEPDFSQACSFRRILMNHKNFPFTPIPDKINDLVFLKRQKSVLGSFLTIFGHSCPMGSFSKKSGSVTHNYIWAPNTMLSFRKS